MSLPPSGLAVRTRSSQVSPTDTALPDPEIFVQPLDALQAFPQIRSSGEVSRLCRDVEGGVAMSRDLSRCHLICRNVQGGFATAREIATDLASSSQGIWR